MPSAANQRHRVIAAAAVLERSNVDDKMRAFVIADAHGNWESVKYLLKQERLHRREIWEKTFIVHVGDLITAADDTVKEDLATLENVAWMFDILLVGNHEHPYWPGYIPKFTGFHYSKEIAKNLDGFNYKAAFEFGNVLVTHAGLSRNFEDTWMTAHEAEQALNERWEKDPSDPLFSTIPLKRGGMSRWGGVLWSDLSEGKSRRFSQVYGHTSCKEFHVTEPRKYGHVQHVCIDLGAKDRKNGTLGGVWIDDDGTITPVSLREPASLSYEVEEV